MKPMRKAAWAMIVLWTFLFLFGVAMIATSRPAHAAETDVLVKLIDKLQDPTVLVLALMCIGEGYLHVIWRREEREDRKAMLDTLKTVTDALTGLRLAISASTGKPL